MMKNKTEGLAGVVAGESAIATVGQAGEGLNYRGYSINDLAAHSTFEEVAFLLLRGHLPTSSELATYTNQAFAFNSKKHAPHGCVKNSMFFFGKS